MLDASQVGAHRVATTDPELARPDSKAKRPTSSAPHSPQNFAPGGAGFEHFGHARATGVPHSEQNLLPGGFSAPQ